MKKPKTENNQSDRTALFYYKCRFCGRCFPHTDTLPSYGLSKPIPEFLMFSLFNATVDERNRVYVREEHHISIPGTTSFHRCKDGDYGVADLVGYRLE